MNQVLAYFFLCSYIFILYPSHIFLAFLLLFYALYVCSVYFLSMNLSNKYTMRVSDFYVLLICTYNLSLMAIWIVKKFNTLLFYSCKPYVSIYIEYYNYNSSFYDMQ